MPEVCPSTYDVIIAGAGPVGLLLACELRLGGCSVLILEKAEDPGSALKHLPFGLRGLTPPTIDILDRRDLLVELQDISDVDRTPATAHWLGQERRPAGHFAGIQFFHDRIDETSWPYRLPSSTRTLAVTMADLENVLAGRAESLGVAIRRGCGVEDLKQTAEIVTVQAGGESFRASWLVGCDGGRSAVRKAAGIAFTGTEPEFTGYSVQVRLSDAQALKPGRQRTDGGMYTFSAPGTLAMVDFDRGAFHRTAPVTPEHVEAVLRKVSGTDVRVDALGLAATWTDRAYQATSYRLGRALLAGDAAHVHSPLGGQGLNLGLGDAMNLGWKLAAEVRGEGPIGLLDSYERERHPVAAQVLDWSRAQVALMRPGSGSHALAAIVRDLADTRDGATYFAGRAQGACVRYDLGPGHPMVGLNAPDLPLADGTRINEHLRSGRGLLLDLGDSRFLRAMADRWNGRVCFVASSAEGSLELAALLVRPDGIVAWASELAGIERGLIDSAGRWLIGAR